MPIPIDCPSCGSRTDVPDTAAGATFQCPRCGVTAPVPAVPSSAFAGSGRASAPRYQPPQGLEDRPQYYPPPSDFARPDGGAGMAITGMVLGIVGLVLSFLPCIGWLFGIILGLLGAIFSGIGLGQGSGKSKNMAITGLILSILAMIWGPVFYFLIFASLAGAAGGLR
jgi:hypothetical protein